MREIAHNWISPVRIKVNASQIAVATAGAAQSEDRSAKQKTTFFDSIGSCQEELALSISSQHRINKRKRYMPKNKPALRHKRRTR
jgi:hypothetical protein